jgi:hypothetical protein
MAKDGPGRGSLDRLHALGKLRIALQGDTTVGQIEDVLVDLDHSSLVAVVLSVGGFLGVGEKLVAVPVNQIKVGTEAKFTTDLTKEQVANAPAFDFGKLK